MKAYVITTGAVFALLVVAHVLRVGQEPALARDPFFIIATLIAAAFCGWSLYVLRRLRGRPV